MKNEHLDAMREMAYACTRCGYCREKYSDDAHTQTAAFRVCPIWEYAGGFEYHCARGKLLVAQGILEGKLDYSQDLIDILYADPDCRLCSWVCNAEPVLDPPQVWRAMRRDIVEAGLGPPPAIREIDSRVQARHNVFGGKPELRARWTDGMNLPSEGDVLYFAGCYTSYTQPEIAQATIKILQKAGIEAAYLGNDEWCCGSVQLHDGSIALAKELAQRNVEIMYRSGARILITSCAECYKSLKIDYPEILGEMPFEVLHISEIAFQLWQDGIISFPRSLSEQHITYHDPCRLGRYAGIYDPPRKILQNIPGTEFVEMMRHRENAWCCGGGSDLVPSVDSELALAIAQDRINDALEAGVQALITACPRCTAMLRKASITRQKNPTEFALENHSAQINGQARSSRGEEIKVYDLSVAMAIAMGMQVNSF